MKFKVKWRLGIYEVNFKNKIKLESLFIYLKIKRVKRFLYRIFVDNKIVFFPFIILSYVFFIIYFSEKYDTHAFIKIIWDFKDIVLTTIFLPSIISEYERSKNLQKQFNVYSRLMYESEQLIKNLTGVIIDYNIFLYEDGNNKFYKEYSISDQILNIDFIQFKYYCLQYKRNIRNEILKLDNIIGNLEFYESDSYIQLINNIDDTIFLIENNIIEYNEQFVKEFVKNFITQAYYFISQYRRPWRWDLETDKKIISILKKEASCIDGIDLIEIYKL